jgi:uncharacterized membrane protein
MATRMIRNPRSTANIAGHPIHAMLVQFPITFFISAFVCDLVYWSHQEQPAWATASLWLIGAGLVMAVFAALAGVADAAGDRQVREMKDLWLHAGGNVLAVALELLNGALRYRGGPAEVVPVGLILSLAVVGILVFTGWKGGALVFRHRVGVADDNEIPPK